MAAGVCCPYAEELSSAVKLPSKPRELYDKLGSFLFHCIYKLVPTVFLDSLIFLEPLNIDQDGLEKPPIYFCPEYDVDFVGNDIAYAAGQTSWQSCGESYYCSVPNSCRSAPNF